LDKGSFLGETLLANILGQPFAKRKVFLVRLEGQVLAVVSKDGGRHRSCVPGIRCTEGEIIFNFALGQKS